MTYLADACALLSFFGAGGTQMGPGGHRAMRATVTVSPITIWELTRRAAIGKLPPLPVERGRFYLHLAALGFRMQPLEWADAEAANRLPAHHKDPMDRMLVATALRADLTIITNDELLAAYGVKTVW